MAYESPIEAIYEDVKTQFEDAVITACQRVNILVKKDELLQALKYDRAQYEKGYEDAKKRLKTPAVDAVPVVRCKDCKHSYDSVGGRCCAHGVCVDCVVSDDFYCADGERRKSGDTNG